jgi:DNA helicase-2/ATP-dependent DNA helicase PcrA
MEIDLVASLNPQQREAVLSNDGPLMILAGAGSGKTKVITHKIAHLIRDLEYPPESIVAVTFTKKAAGEMTERINTLLGHPPHRKYFIGTFHSYGAMLLRKNARQIGMDASFSIYDSDDQLSVVKSICKDFDISVNLKPTAIQGRISEAKSKGITADEYFKNSYGDDFDEVVSRVYKEYVKRLKSLNAVDFDDLLSKVVDMFEQHPNILAKYQEENRFVLVDEYQDTNIQQYKIVRALASKHRHLCVVGDEDQSIYSWRGATVDNIKFFQKDFPEHQIIKLEQNYRSTKVILDAANFVISKNPNRIAKSLWTDNPGSNPIIVNRLEDPFMESMFVLREVDKYRRNLDDVAILYRVNSLSRNFEDIFVKYNIPYKLVGGVGFYQRLEVKDVLAYLKFINNARDEVSMLRIINTPSRKIGDKAIGTLKELSKKCSLTFGEFIWYGSLLSHDDIFASTMMSQEYIDKVLEHGGEYFKKYSHFFSVMGELIKESFDPNRELSQFIQLLIDRIEYKQWIQKMAATKEEEISRIANVNELSAVAVKQPYTGREGLNSFLQDIALVEETKEANETNTSDIKGRIQLMSIHAAKGLEFGTVFIVGLEEGSFPHSRSLTNPIQLQEERRLFYVAVTRAKKQLYLTSAKKRHLGNISFETVVSQYLADIPAALKNDYTQQ